MSPLLIESAVLMLLMTKIFFASLRRLILLSTVIQIVHSVQGFANLSGPAPAVRGFLKSCLPRLLDEIPALQQMTLLPVLLGENIKNGSQSYDFKIPVTI